MEMSTEAPIFTSVQQVLDFIGTEYAGGPCNAITALTSKTGRKLAAYFMPTKLSIGVSWHLTLTKLAA